MMSAACSERFRLFEVVPGLVIVEAIDRQNGEIILDNAIMGIEFMVSLENFLGLKS